MENERLRRQIKVSYICSVPRLRNTDRAEVESAHIIENKSFSVDVPRRSTISTRAHRTYLAMQTFLATVRK